MLPVLVHQQILSTGARTVDYSTGTCTVYLLANQYQCPYCSHSQQEMQKWTGSNSVYSMPFSPQP